MGKDSGWGHRLGVSIVVAVIAGENCIGIIGVIGFIIGKDTGRGMSVVVNFGCVWIVISVIVCGIVVIIAFRLLVSAVGCCSGSCSMWSLARWVCSNVVWGIVIDDVSCAAVIVIIVNVGCCKGVELALGLFSASLFILEKSASKKSSILAVHSSISQ